MNDDLRRYPDLRERRAELRRSATNAESLLWKWLRNRGADGRKFRRQQQLGPYIADFYCSQAGLVVEVDGSQHYEAEGREDDAVRSAYLESRGLTVLRFRNAEVLTNIDRVLSLIEEHLDRR